MVLDTESILIPSLNLQMRNPGYFFWTGNTTYPDGLSGQGSNSDIFQKFNEFAEGAMIARNIAKATEIKIQRKSLLHR